MTYSLEFDARALKEWHKLGDTVREQLKKKLVEVLVNPRVEMANLIGDDVADWPRLMADPSAHVHLYGKAEARPGRKMGHVTRLGK